MFGGLEYELAGDAVDLLLTAGRVGGSVTLVAALASAASERRSSR